MSYLNPLTGYSRSQPYNITYIYSVLVTDPQNFLLAERNKFSRIIEIVNVIFKLN